MSIRSMTGFGRGTSAVDDLHATVELASVNRKQAEIAVSAPRELSALEPRIRQAVMPCFSRGRVQVSINITHNRTATSALLLDHTLALALEAEFTRLSNVLGRELRPNAADFLTIPGLLQGADLTWDIEQAWAAIEQALSAALAEFTQARSAEGKSLHADLTSRLRQLAAELAYVTGKAPGRAARQAELLGKRLAELNCPIDPTDERLLKEIALFADRCDISEEITRLHSHLEAFTDYLSKQETPGRALDFLCQEIHREWNTIGSKAADSDIAQAVVRAKSELEKIREQVQNIE